MTVVPTPKNFVHVGQIFCHQTPNRSFITEIRQGFLLHLCMQKPVYTCETSYGWSHFLMCAFSCNAEQWVVYVWLVWILFITYQTHVNPNLSFPSETRVLEALKRCWTHATGGSPGDSFHPQLCQSSGKTHNTRGHLPSDPELFFLWPGGAGQIRVFSVNWYCAVIISHILVEWQSKLSRKRIYMQQLDYICPEILLC